MKFSLKSFMLGFVCSALAIGTVTYVNASSNSTIKACANKKTGAMRYIAKGKCKKTETSLSWNQIGQQGSPGTPGATGAPGVKGETGARGDSGAPSAFSPTGFTPRAVCGANGTTLCAVGVQGPGGGTVFYVDTKNEIAEFDYLEAAPTNAIFHGGDSSGVWATDVATCGATADEPCNSSYVSDAARALETRALGTGRAATKAIVARHLDSSIPKTSYAAGAADAYETTTASDWWLPSWEESLALCKLAVSQTVVSESCLGGALRPEFRTGMYWTSTGYTFGVLVHDFADGGGGLDSKTAQAAVHPIRGF